ncbi:MAG: histidine--tRNA ligase [bacterium]|nr:histidine--tRNA ligase [bacterium]
MAKQIVQPVKGTRDFYPEQMAFRNWLYGKVKEISERFGYQEYDGPEIEYVDLYANKTNQEILSQQIFTLKDRDGKLLALRPELTPTFARMVAQKSQQLPKPIRWFSFGRMWRYEQPQKGRGREFFQWEINILGPESPEADAEILAIAAEYFKTLGLTPQEVVIRVSDREFMQKELRSFGISEEQIAPAFRVIDRKEKIDPSEFRRDLEEVGLSKSQTQSIESLLTEKDYSQSPWLKEVFASLKLYEGALDYIEFDPTIVRGFDYYTRTVFEAWDKTGQLKRSIFGGGRFDNLTAQIGGERVPGIGMAPGDMPTQVVLEQFNKMPDLTPKTAQVLVTVFAKNLYSNSLQTADKLRSQNIDTEIWLDTDSRLDKQLKYADQKGIPFCLIIGPEEVEKGVVTLKDLKSKTQTTLTLDEAVSKLSRSTTKS